MQNKQKMLKRILLTISQDNSKLRSNFYFNRGNTVKRNNYLGELLPSREAFWKKMFSGRSMVEMLAVLAIIGVLSVASIVGFRYAMDKYKSNSIYSDVHLLALYVMDTGRDTLPADFYPDSGVAFSIDTNTYSNGFVVKAPDVSEGICERIMDVKDSSIEEVYVGSEGSTVCSGTQTIGFMFLYDGEYASGDDSSGNTGSGSGVTDPCEGIVVSTDCGISEDVKDENGCVLVQKISCSPGRYCLGQTCEPCPAADSCSGESCCALTGPDDVCGNPTKEIGTISTVTHSDLNSNGCCESTTEESCSLNPITPRTCTPTCEGTCQADGTCEVVCPANTYGKDCTPCGSGAISNSGDSVCTCDTANGFKGIWVANASNSEENGCMSGNTCTSNANCKANEYCSASNAGKEPPAGTCQLISSVNPQYANGYTYSVRGMAFWQVQNWCTAQGLKPVSRAYLGCPDAKYNDTCNTPTAEAVKSLSSSLEIWLDSDFEVYYNAYRLGYNYLINYTAQPQVGAAVCYQ